MKNATMCRTLVVFLLLPTLLACEGESDGPGDGSGPADVGGYLDVRSPGPDSGTQGYWDLVTPPDLSSSVDIGSSLDGQPEPDTGVSVAPEVVDQAEALWEAQAPALFRIRLQEQGGWSWNDRYLTVVDGRVVGEELRFVPDDERTERISCGTSSACCLTWEDQEEGFMARAFRSLRCFLGNYPVAPSFDEDWGFPSYWGRDIPDMWDDEESYWLSELRPGGDDCPLLCRGDRPCLRDDEGCVVSEEIVDGCPPHDSDYAAAIEEASRCESDEDCSTVERSSLDAVDCVPPAMENNGYDGRVAVGPGGRELLEAQNFEQRWADRGCALPLCDGFRRQYTLEARCLEVNCVLDYLGGHSGSPMSCYGGRLFDLPDRQNPEPDPRCAGVPDCTFVSEPDCLCSEGFCFVRREP